MRFTLIFFVAAGLFAATAVEACPACGDKLSLTGGGVSFERVNKSGPPARVLMLATQGSPLQTADTDLGLVAEFKRSGYDVTVVKDSSELDHALHENAADVVIVHWSEVAATAERLGNEGTPPAIVPVAYKAEDAAAAKAAGAGQCVAQAEQRKGRKLAATVDRVIEKRRKGEPVDCPVVVASRTG